MTNETVLETLYASVRDVMPELAGAPLDAASSLHDLGLNSMERAEVIMETLFALDLRLPMTAFARARNLGDIAHTISSGG